MAYSTTMESVSTKLREGWAEWVKSGYTLLGQFRAMLLAHTHSGTTDGANIPTTSLSGTITNAQLAGDIAATKLAGSITNTYLSTAAKTNVNCTKWLVSSTAGDAEYPVFEAPVACVISKVQLVTAANVVGDATDYNTLRCKQYTAGVLGGTLASTTSGTAGTWLAHQPKDLGTITGGTLAANDVLTIAKATAAGGTAIADCLAVITWFATAA